MEHQITRPGPLLDDAGQLREPGWAKAPLLSYDRKAIKAPAWRIKEWDYYCVIAGDTALAVTVADNGYMGLLSASFLDLAAGKDLTGTIMTALPMGRTLLPASSASGATAAHAKDLDIRIDASNGTRTLKVNWPGFRSVGLIADIVLRELPPRESMVIATPFSGAPRAFYYNQKINCQDVDGFAVIGGRTVSLESGKAFGVLDWGRGVWPWRNTWLWGSASGLSRVVGKTDQVRFGFNIGYGFGDTRAASENMVFVEGKAHKIGHLKIELDDHDFMKPWHATSDDGRFDLSLAPLLDRHSSSDFLVLASIQHQVFGTWTGTVRLEDGSVIEVDGLTGFCEKVINRW